MAALDQGSFIVELPIYIRTATLEDIPRLEWYGQYKHYRNLFRKAYREQMLGKRLIIVAACNNFPIGYLFIQLQSGNPRIADGKTRAYFYSFRVMEIFQSRGIGTQLLSEAETMMAERGYRWGTIAVAKDNTAAKRLYERLGYRIFAEDPGKWSYTDHTETVRNVEEPCWLLEKNFKVR